MQRKERVSRESLITFALIILFILVCVLPSCVPKENVYLVKLKSLPDFQNGAIQKQGFTASDLYPELNEGEMGRWVVVRSPEDIRAIIEHDPDVESVDDGLAVFKILDSRLRRDYEHKDKTWGIRVTQTREGLEILNPNRNIIVAVVDTGCDLKHRALKERLVQGRNFAGGDVNDPSYRDEEETHATHVTGTIIAELDADGFFGIAKSVAKVMPIRVLDEGGSGTMINIAQGVVYATDHGAHVINMSLGSPFYPKALHDAVKYAVGKGVTVVCARGNSNSPREMYPGSFPEVIGVTATALREDGSETRAYFSSYGKDATCAAPGHIIYSTLPGGKYGFYSGTSMASPHAAACAAVLLSQEKLTPEQVKAAMKELGDEVKSDQPIGRRINLLKLVKRNCGPPTSVPEQAYDEVSEALLELIFPW